MVKLTHSNVFPTGRAIGRGRIAATALLLAMALSGWAAPAHAQTGTAIFAGGCFWCIEKDFENVEGVVDVVSGYSGGTTDNPTYETHRFDEHLEVVRITYDPAVTSYEKLLDTYWRTVDPTDDGGQFCDRGHSYTTAIFALDEEQAQQAAASKAAAEKALGQAIVTPIRAAAPFHMAEDYHQNYYKKSPSRYTYYRWACGRNQRVEALWGEEAYRGVKGH